MRRVLDGTRGPHRDVVVLNSAAGLAAAGRADAMEEGIAQAQASIDSGAAAATLHRLASESAAARDGR